MGRGISDTFQRVGSDLLTTDGQAKVAQIIRQVANTRRGSVPWRSDIGSDIHRVLHRGRTTKSAEMVKAMLIRALDDLPDITELRVDAVPDDSGGGITATVQFRYRSDGRTAVVSSTFRSG